MKQHNNNSPERIPITKKIRFEVFKRDGFTCQYCGSKAPDVILNVDHIKPVKEGGTNDILNLVTSCFACNNGKRAREIGDNSVVAKQRRQIEELEERRSQLEMILEWRDGLKNLQEVEVAAIERAINGYMKGYTISESYKSNIAQWLRKYSLKLILDAIDIAGGRYIGTGTEEELRNYLDKIPGILKNSALPPLEQKVAYVSGYVSKKYRQPFWKVKNLLMEYCEALRDYDGFPDEEIIDYLAGDFNKVLQCERWSFFSKKIEGWIDEIKNGTAS